MENRVRIKIGNFEFEASGDENVIERERKIIMELIPQLISANHYYNEVENIATIENNDVKKMSCEESIKALPVSYASINQFLKAKQFGNSIDTTLGIIYYIEKYEKVSTINQNIIKEYYEKAKTKLPINLSQNFSNLTQKGFIKTLNKEKNGIINYSITMDGEDFIESYEPKETNKKTKKTVIKTNNNVKDEILSLTRENLNLHKYTKVKDVKEFKGKMLLAMYIVSKNSSIDKFSVNDINYILVNIFQESVTIDQIKGVIKREPTWFNKTKNETSKLYEYNLLIEGLDYAENISKI